MANKKLSALTELAETPASGDMVPVVDVSDTTGASTGTTKRVSVDNLISNVAVADMAASAVVLEAEGISGNDNDTTLPTSAAVKDYVDTNVTAQDLDFQGDSGGALAIDLDSETLTIAGGTGIDTVGSGNTVTSSIDSTVATLSGSQTLTNKILTSPVINTGVSGTAVLDDDTFGTATSTTIATAESIKTYVDAQIFSVENLDFAGDSGTGSVAIDAQTFTIATGANLTTAASSQTLTVNLDTTITGLTSVTSTAFVGDLTGNSATVTTNANLTGDVTSVGNATTLGTVPVAKGGTGATTVGGARTALGVDAAGTDNSTNVTLAGTPDYITISGQTITRGQVDLAADVTGNLPTDNQNSGTNASETTFWRGDGTWVTPSGSGDVTKVGTPLDNEVGVWTGDGTIEGTPGLTYTGTSGTLPSSTGNLIVANNSASGSTTAISIIGGTAGNCYLNFGDDDDENSGFIGYDPANETMSFRTAGAGTDMTILSSGNVGIGTAAPSATLHIKPSSGNANIRVESDDGAADVEIQLDTSGTSRSGWVGFQSDGVLNGAVGYSSASSTLKLVGGDSFADEHLCISSTGLVGMGLADTTRDLEVRKDQNAPTLVQVTNDGTGTAAQAQLRVLSNSAHGIMTVCDDGFTPSGVYQPDTFSVVAASSSSGGIILGTQGDHDVSFYQNNAVAMTLDSTGLGIGTAVPGEKLTVDGNIETTGTVVLTELADAATATATKGQIWVKNDAPNTLWFTDDADNDKQIDTAEIGIACSDETTAITTGTAKATFRIPRKMTLTGVRASVTTAPTSSTIIVDINEGGTTILSTKLTIDASEKTSTTAATPAVISDSALADDAEVTIDIDQIGSGTAGAGLKIWLLGYWTK